MSTVYQSTKLSWTFHYLQLKRTNMNKIKSKNRFASIWFPQLPLEAILSKEPLLDSLPLVVSFSDGEEIICANELAKKLKYVLKCLLKKS